MRHILTLVTITLLTAAACKKNNAEVQLPPETQTGKNTFGCKVDGKVYTAWGKGGLIGFDNVSYVLISSDSSINIFASTADPSKPRFSLSLKIKYLGTLGNYKMGRYPYRGVYLDGSIGSLPSSDNQFLTNDTTTGEVNVKYFDGSYVPINGGSILSGTFEMDVVNGEGKVVHITDGRFDIGQ